MNNKIDLKDLTNGQIKSLLGETQPDKSRKNLNVLEDHFNGISFNHKDDMLEISNDKNPDIAGEEALHQTAKVMKILGIMKTNLLNQKKAFSERVFLTLIENIKKNSDPKPLAEDNTPYRGVAIHDSEFLVALTNPKITKAIRGTLNVNIEASTTLDKIKIYPMRKSVDHDKTLGNAERIISYLYNNYKKEPSELKAITVRGVKDAVKNMNRIESLAEEEASMPRNASLEKSFAANKNTVLVCHGTKVTPRDESQALALEALQQEKLVTIITGNASSGKTFIAVAYAVSQLKAGKIEKIYLARPLVEAGENLGFQKGTLNEKVDHYMQPLYDALEELIPLQTLNSLYAQKVIQIAPLAFLRGKTLKNSILIVDEIQNGTDGQIRMAISRPDVDARIIATGDVIQNDRTDGLSGLQIALDVLEGDENVNIVNCTGCFRHPGLASILERYAAYDANKAGIVSINKPLQNPANDNAKVSDAITLLNELVKQPELLQALLSVTQPVQKLG